MNAKDKKRVIYVDAGQNSNNKKFQIALYDPSINLTSVVELININDNNLAERYAIINAVLYIKSKNLSKTVILCDNENATKTSNILKLCEKFKIKLSWIPREINLVADKMSKSPPTKKDDSFYTIDLIYNLVFQTNSTNTTNTNKQNTKK